MTATRDPLGRVIRQEWCNCGRLNALVDSNGNRTAWVRDALGRVTTETRANAAETVYTYDASGRLETVTDPSDQVKTFAYGADNRLTGINYTDETVSTPDVTYTYDTSYPRISTRVDGTGTTTFTYKTPGQLGAGQVATIDGPLSNDTTAYTYDELGRATARAINSVSRTITYDPLGRVTGETNPLGTFAFTYVNETPRLETVTYPNDQTSTYSYFGTTQDARLQTILHQRPDTSAISRFDYTYNTAGQITTWTQQADSDDPLR